jgi:membrane-associated phospholipid phosphatase
MSEVPPAGTPVEGVDPVEERLARRLTGDVPGRHPAGEAVAAGLRRLGHYDRVLYVAVARIPTSAVDPHLRRLSGFANHSKPWFLLAAGIGLVGGPAGRRAAVRGVLAIGAASLLVNQPMKLLGDRDRPDRTGHEVPEGRWVPMPTSSSFPSGHSASAAAFAVAVGDALPVLRLPLRAAAATVAFSRVHTGVHYPGDVLVGATTGALLGRLVTRLADRRVHR